MSLNMNKVFLKGNVVRDSELKYTKAGNPITVFTIAVNTPHKNKDGTWGSDVAFMDVSIFADRMFTKGEPVFIEGSIVQDNWQDKNGNKRSKLKIKAYKVSSLVSKKTQTDGTDNDDDDDIEF